MQKTTSISLFITGLWVLVLFLTIFEKSWALPSNLAILGRLHPLILHLPIGFFFALWLFWGIRKYINTPNYERLYLFGTGIMAILSLITAAAGLFLSKSNSSTDIDFHKYSGLLFTLLVVLLFEFNQPDKKWFVGIKILATIVLLISGHLGGELTHGEDFLFGSKTADTSSFQLQPNDNIYTKAVFPIIEQKCLQCHNDNKTKGQLNMKSLALMLKGGKNGAALVVGDALNSHLIQRINLPLDDKKHMPPKSKAQLTNDEMLILTAWINNGAKTNQLLKDIKTIPAYYAIFTATKTQNKTAIEDKYDFSAAKKSLLDELNTPFCSVEPLAVHSPALRASFYVSAKFDTQKLKDLTKVKEQLVELNLNKMPLGSNEIQILNEFTNLKKLYINSTGISSKDLALLKPLKHLKVLSIANNQLTAEALLTLENFKSLEYLYTWESGINTSEIQNWAKKYPNFNIITGYNASQDVPIKINPPYSDIKKRILKKGEKISFKHAIKGVELRYTDDSSMPDSLSKIYQKPLTIESFKTIKIKAFKQGWLSSDVVEKVFFVADYLTDEAKLLKPTDKQYRGSGISTLIDGKEGDIDNFKDGSWLGFRDNSAEMEFKLPKGVTGISLSWLVDAGSFIMPPSQIEILASKDGKHFKLLTTFQPKALVNYKPKSIDGYNWQIKDNYNYLRVKLHTLKKLPTWHDGKGQKAWVFIDEVYFW